MGKVAFVFSGQGAQYSGMGSSLYEVSAAARKVFDAAETIRPGTIRQCFEGATEELSITRNTQPCLFCVDLAAAEALREAGVQPDMAAGFSLGEVAAVTFGGLLSVEEGFALVAKRGEYMQAAAEKADTAMAAVLKLPNEKVEALCGEHPQVYPVNYNCPGQLVVAGLKSSMEGFSTAAAANGGRTVPLNVSGGFHSPFMAEAAEQLGNVLQNVKFCEPDIPVFANYDTQPYTAETAGDLLKKQVCSPVRWQQTVEKMIEEGVDTFIEVGAGKTLCGLIKKTNRNVKAYNVENAETLNAVLTALRETV